MPKLIIFIALILTLVLGWHQLKTLPPIKRKRALIQIGFWAIVAIILLSVVTGRLHWVGAVLAAAAGLLKAVLPKLIQYLPAVFSFLKQRKESSDKNSNEKATPISEAYAILDLAPGATKNDIIEAHRRKMQKAHPDKGGSHDHAAKLNEAKDILLDYLNRQ